MVTVVKINRARNNYTIYGGREWAGIPGSPFQNPFHIRNGVRGTAILDFVFYWYAPEQDYLRELAMNLPEDAVIGCWCKPLDCHCDFVAGYVNWKREKQTWLNG